MKFTIAALALIASSGIALAQSPQSTTANVPTGYQVKGSAEYNLIPVAGGWKVVQRPAECNLPRTLNATAAECFNSMRGATGGGGAIDKQ